MAKNDKPAAKSTGGQGAPAGQEQETVGGGENATNPSESSTAGHAPTSSQDGLPSAGYPTDGSKPGAQTGANDGDEAVSLAGSVQAAGGEDRPQLSDFGRAQIAPFKRPAESAYVLGIEVTAQRDGYRRGGRGWSRTPQTVALRDLTDQQIEQLKADPAIRIHGVRIPVDTEGESA